MQKNYLHTFIESARNGSTLVRCNRDGSNVAYLFLLHGTVENNPVSVLLSLTFTGSPPELDLSSNAAVTPLDNIEAAVFAADSALAVNLFQLLRNLRVWAGFLT